MNIILPRDDARDDLEVCKKVTLFGCIYDLSGNNYAFIKPEDNVLISDIDGFLIDSQKSIDEEVGKIDSEASPARRERLEASRNVIMARLKDMEETYKRIAIAENLTTKEIRRRMEADQKYKNIKLDLLRNKNDFDDYQKRKDDILAERVPTMRKIDYEAIFRNCSVDEAACRMLVENVGPDKLFKKGLAESWYNRNPIEAAAKVKRLRPHLGNLPILFAPWPEEKVYILENIHGKFNFSKSLILDDQSVVETDTKDRYPDMNVEIRIGDEPTICTIERGFQKVKAA